MKESDLYKQACPVCSSTEVYDIKGDGHWSCAACGEE